MELYELKILLFMPTRRGGLDAKTPETFPGAILRDLDVGILGSNGVENVPGFLKKYPYGKGGHLRQSKESWSKKNIYSRCITHAPSGATMREVGVVYSAHILL